ncbi:hypothetical protein [Mycolicibacterium vinylchloridicum]|uniref:hypothetical protein n=1 Tax=Mycolicibacterium vinylchloridicum TaxID=2736928 RepID=UPI00022E3018|nr:hypothetical protein [Mycolicibacterium vinylchloridicum]EHB46378.1 hypothetical protein MycrhDRAFT_6182 [Mycolicibacterium rhodesiae JS60]
MAEPWDKDGLQGVPDARLYFVDGRTAAFEVTELVHQPARHTEALLARDGHIWPTPGKWWWTINVGSPLDLPRLRTAYIQVIVACESADVQHPTQIAWGPDADEDVRWLVQESSCSMTGHPGAADPYVMVVPKGGGGAVDTNLAGLTDALNESFARQSHIVPHFEKLQRAEADERHLFAPVHYTGLNDSVSLGLMFNNDALPPEAPPVPEHIDALWLAPQFSKRVLLWTRNTGWRNLYPYN